MDLEELTKLHIPAKEQGKNIYRVDTQFGTVIYYSAKDMWLHKGRHYEGSIEEFRAWLKKQKLI